MAATKDKQRRGWVKDKKRKRGTKWIDVFNTDEDDKPNDF